MPRFPRIEELASGLSVDEALAAFVDGCRRPGQETLFLPSSQMDPLLEELSGLLSSPISADQANALRGAVYKKHSLESVICWLNADEPITWPAFLELWREEEATEAR